MKNKWMNKMVQNIINKAVLVTVICSLIFSVSISNVNASNDSLYSRYTKTLVTDSIKYLNEVYLKKYPSLGLTLRYGTIEEKEIIKNLAKQITKNAKTDLEKANAIYNWISKNIKFNENASAYPMDTLYSKSGNCMSDSNLMISLLKSVGIKSALVGGVGENMTSKTTLDGLTGHGWVMAYINSKWTLYDVPKRIKAETNIDSMAKNYYFAYVDFVFIDTFCSKKYGYQVTYNNGFKVLNATENEVPNISGSLFNNIPIVFVTNKYVILNASLETYNCSEEAKDDVYNAGLGYINNEEDFYAFENGILSLRNEMMIGNKKCVILDSGCFIVKTTKAPYYFMNGELCFSKGDTISIVKREVADNLNDFKIQWSSSEPTIVKVSENNELQCLKNGKVNLLLKITNKNTHTTRSLNLSITVGNGRPAINFPADTDDISSTSKFKSLKTKIKTLKNKKNKKLYVKWKKIAGADGYQIKYALNKKFTKKKKTKNVKKTSVTLKKLTKKKYFIKVRAYKKINGKRQWSKWSKIKSKKIKK